MEVGAASSIILLYFFSGENAVGLLAGDGFDTVAHVIAIMRWYPAACFLSKTCACINMLHHAVRFKIVFVLFKVQRA